MLLKGEVTEMASARSKSFRDLKDVLSKALTSGTSDLPYAVKERAMSICACYLGGIWKTISVQEAQISRVNGGMSNLLFLCQLPVDAVPVGDEPSKTLLRIYFNVESETKLVTECVIFTLLSERHLGPKLYGIFSGGRLEEYIRSRPLLSPELQQPNISYRIAQKMARIHRLSVPVSKDPTYVIEAVQRWIKHLKEETKHFPEFTLEVDDQTVEVNEQRIMFELELVRQFMNNSDSPVVFCHNDLHQGNILLPEESQDRCKDVVFIDYEYSGYNYRGFDIANHFNEWMFDYAVTSSPGFVVSSEHFPNESRQKLFFSGYLKELQRPVSGESLQALYAEVAGFVPLTNFFWAVWGLLQFEISPIDFDFLEFAKVRFHLYFKNRRVISSYLKEVYQVGVDEPGVNRVIESEPIAT